MHRNAESRHDQYMHVVAVTVCVCTVVVAAGVLGVKACTISASDEDDYPREYSLQEDHGGRERRIGHGCSLCFGVYSGC